MHSPVYDIFLPLNFTHREMKKHHSYFKDPGKDIAWFYQWVDKLSTLNQRTFEKAEVQSLLGKTIIWKLNAARTDLPALVIFPGFRTTPLFWDLDKGLDELIPSFRVYLVETNGQPNPGDGDTPDIRSDGYGKWAADLLQKLDIEKCYIAGASFGGNVCVKLCLEAPQKILGCFLLNPGCLQNFSLSFKNLYYNLLPIFSPREKNVRTFLDKAVFSKPEHTLTKEQEQLIVDFEVFALTRYKDKTQKPYFMKDELTRVETPVWLLLGDKDILFPTQRSAENAKKLLINLREIFILQNVGHGIETYRPALEIIRNTVVGE